MSVAIDPDLGNADINAIKRMIPHRYPVLLIDRVVNIDPHKAAVGLKGVTANEPYFEGHFPARPVMPGVLIVEAMAQTAGVLVVRTLGMYDSDRLVYFMSIEGAKFRSVVQPGEVLELHVAVLRGRSKVWKFHGEARVGNRLCAEAQFTAMIMSPEDAEAKG
jgi:3-hydroxyacyl-[acyl-carrier-protein] dehydratase